MIGKSITPYVIDRSMLDENMLIDGQRFLLVNILHHKIL